jgi:single-stranded DNA-binding protein
MADSVRSQGTLRNTDGCHVSLVGTINDRSAAVFLPTARKTIYKVNVEVDGDKIPVCIYGDAAKELEGLIPPIRIAIEGRLKIYKWTAKTQDERSAAEVDVLSFEIL